MLYASSRTMTASRRTISASRKKLNNSRKKLNDAHRKRDDARRKRDAPDSLKTNIPRIKAKHPRKSDDPRPALSLPRRVHQPRRKSRGAGCPASTHIQHPFWNHEHEIPTTHSIPQRRQRLGRRPPQRRCRDRILGVVPQRRHPLTIRPFRQWTPGWEMDHL